MYFMCDMHDTHAHTLQIHIMLYCNFQNFLKGQLK